MEFWDRDEPDDTPNSLQSLRSSPPATNQTLKSHTTEKKIQNAYKQKRKHKITKKQKK